MARFVYSALRAGGERVTGEVEANDRAAALRRVRGKGVQLLSLAPAGSAAAAPAESERDSKRGGFFSAPKKTTEAAAEQSEATAADGSIKLKRAQIVLFTEELSDMLAAGLQLEPALRVMEQREEISKLKPVITAIRDRVRDGVSFSSALNSASPSFGHLYTSLAAAGEASGALPTILRRQADYLKTIQQVQSKFVQAMLYPIFLIGAAIFVMIVFVSFLLPQLTRLLEQTGGELPLGARFIEAIGIGIVSYWWVGAIVLIGLIFAVKIYLGSERNRKEWDRVKLNLPLLGPIMQARFFVQLLETLSNLVGNGLPLLRSLELARNTTGNLYLHELMGSIVERVSDGASLSRTMKRVGFFPPLLIDMISVGEQTGRIEEALARAADRYDRELSLKITRMTTIIPYIILIMMALLIGAFFYMMFTAIQETISGMRGA